MSDLNFEGLSDKQLRLFAVRCARRVQHLMTDPRSVAALDVAERYAKGEATDDELSAARAAAMSAATDAAWAASAAEAAAWTAAWDAAWAASAAASAAAWDATRDAASAAASAAAWAVWDASAAELAEQKKILDEIRQEQPK